MGTKLAPVMAVFDDVARTVQLMDGEWNDPVGPLMQVGAPVSGGGNRAYRAWMAQPKSYQLAAVPAPTRFIDFNRGSDANDGLTPATAWKTLQKLQTALPAAGNCIALANDSTFDLTDRLSFSVAGSTALNGASDSNRLTFTNYDPGGYPTQRPRIRFRYLPTAGQWVWDATFQAWYYVNQNSRSFTRDALGRMAGNWGSQKSVNGQALVAGLLARDFDMFSDDTNKRMYVYAPAGTNPTDYYGGAGSVVLGEGEGAALGFSRCGKFVTVDNLVFEECGLAVLQGNFGGSESLSGLIVQRSTFLNCGRAIYGASDANSAYTMTAKVLGNTFRGIGGSTVHTYCKDLGWELAGNLFSGINESMSAGGGLYAQEASAGTTAHGNNIAYENFIEKANFNRGLSPYDGAGLYIEVRGKGWTLTRNFITKSHHGIYNNSGVPVIDHKARKHKEEVDAQVPAACPVLKDRDASVTRGAHGQRKVKGGDGKRSKGAASLKVGQHSFSPVGADDAIARIHL